MTTTSVGRLRRFASIASWTSADQVLSSLSNLVVTVAVARAAGAEGLGRYAVAFALYIVVLGLARSFVTEPLLTLQRDRDGDRVAESRALTLTLLFGAGCGVALGVVGLLLGRLEIAVVAAALPVVLVQDAFRYFAFRRRVPAVAAQVDAAWVVVSLAAWPIVVGSGSAVVAAVCWGAGAAAGCVVGVGRLRPVLAAPGAAWRWWRAECQGISRALLVDSVLAAGSAQLIILLLAGLAGNEAAGLLRAGQLLFTPLSLALTAATLVLVPTLAQRPVASGLRTAFVISGGLGAVCVAATLLLVTAKELLNGVVFDGAIEVGYGLLAAAALQVVFTAGAAGFLVVAKVNRRGRKLISSRAVSGTIGLLVFFWAAANHGVEGAAWALVVQAAWYAGQLAAESVFENRRQPALSEGPEK